MSKIDFFDKKFVKELSRNDNVFYLYDDGNGSVKSTISNTDKSQDFDCVVMNEQKKNIQFVAVDNNIPLCEENRKIKACDGMFYNKNNTNDFIIFVELKSGKYLRNWRS